MFFCSVQHQNIIMGFYTINIKKNKDISSHFFPMSSYARRVGSKYKKSSSKYPYSKRPMYRRSSTYRKQQQGTRGYTLIQSVDLGQYAINTGGSVTADTTTAWSVKLEDFGNATQFTALYDQFRFKKLTFHIFPLMQSPVQQYAPVGSDNACVPTLYTAIDYTDDTPVGCDEILEYSNAKVMPFNTSCYRALYPKTNITTTTGSMQLNGYIPTSNTTQRWYGLKASIQNIRTGTAESEFYYQVICKAEIEFKNVK